MDKKGFRVIKELPKDLKMQPNEFVEVTDGVWINVLEAGDIKDMAESGKTAVLVRFSYQSTSERLTGPLATFSNIDNTETAISPVTFVYQANINPDYQQGSIEPAPNSTSGEQSMSRFACNAMMIALKYVPLGSTIQMFTSFREGPSFTFQNSVSFANENDAGVALYYDKIRFTKKP